MPIRLATAAALAISLGACATHEAPHKAKEDYHPIVGGYAKANVDDAPVKAAKDLAVAELYKKFPQRGIVEKATAEQQVVAGMNYRFEITMSGGKTYEAVVYRELQGQMSVTRLEATN